MTAIYDWFKNSAILNSNTDARKKLFWYICFVASILFVIVFQHLPIAYFANAAHDDGWFVHKAISIASGQWFGPTYNNYTLMKGPGYPLFLVLVSVTGIPIGMAEAGFLAFSLGLLCLNLARLTGAYRSCAVIFAVTLWHPAFLVPRLLREGIFPAQVFLVLALMIDIFLLARTRKRAVVSSLLFGIAFAWFWLTREEGAWVLPALATFLVGAVILAWRDSERLRNLTIAVAIMLASSLAWVSSFGLINKMEYGSFQLVDFKDAGFNDALDALYSVQVGDPTPYLPLPKRVRLEVYKVSPHFAELRRFFDGQQTTPWSNEGCQLYPQTCGDIAGGWIVWAMRDAAVSAGKYVTPDGTSKFFSDIAKEVRDACAKGTLTCKSPLVSGLPYISAAQFANLPARMFDAVKSILLSEVMGLHPGLIQSSGDPTAIEHGAQFLNTRSFVASQAMLEHKYTFNGWYMDPGHGWFKLIGHGENFVDEVTVPRLESPDLVAAFHDAAANRQRFSVPILCDPNCTLEIHGESASGGPVKFSDLHGAGAIQVGTGQFYVDTITDSGSAASTIKDPRQAVADKVRIAAAQPYLHFGAAVLICGLIAFVATIFVPQWRKQMTSDLRAAQLVALTLWLLVGARVLLLALIHISFFPGVTPLYVMPAYYLAWLAAGLSLTCLGGVFQSEYRRRRHPQLTN